MAIAAIADAVTMLALPPGGEANPIAAALLAISPVVAIAAKGGLVVALAMTWEHLRGRARNAVYGFATVAWSFGAITNVATVWR
jgi:hypothetical protein